MAKRSAKPTAVLAVCIYRYLEPSTMVCIENVVQTGRYALLRYYNDALICRARSMAASEFLRSCKQDVMAFVDADMVFTVEDLDRIVALAREKQCVAGGGYPIRRAQEGWPAVRLLDGDKQELAFGPGQGPRLVRYVGTGFIAIHRKVIERLAKDQPFCSGAVTSGFYPIFQPFPFQHPNGEWEYMGEDWAFPVVPDTLVLDRDFRWRPAGSFEIGETLVGLDEESPPHSSRRLGDGVVLGKIQRTLPLWRIVTDEGELLTTAEHPWLVRRNWRRPVGHHKYERPLEAPSKWCWTPTADIRPGDELASIMPISKGPDLEGSDYWAGYTQGIWQGDGSLRERNGQLRMCDIEAIHKALVATHKLGIPATARGPYSAEGGGCVPAGRHRPFYAANVGKAGHDKLAALIGLTAIPSADFARGYLGGIYDAEGNYDGATVSIHNHGPQILARIEDAMALLGFVPTRDERRVRLTGMDNVHRFMMETLPAIPRKKSLNGQNGHKEALHRPVTVLSVEQTGRKGEVVCLTTSTGTFLANGLASHNCERVFQAGLECWMDMSLDIGHMGSYQYRLPDVAQRLDNDDERSLVLRDLAGYWGKTLPEAVVILENGENPQEALAEEWRKRDPKTPEEVDQFYRETEGYLKDLVVWNVSPQFWHEITVLLRVRGKVADFGGGIGSLALALARRGVEVSYVDLPSPQRAFAEWRFNCHKEWAPNISVHTSLEELRDLDVIVSNDTLEHLHPDTLPLYAKQMFDALRPGGQMRAVNRFGDHPGQPMHYDSAELYMEAMKGAGFEGGPTVWVKPA